MAATWLIPALKAVLPHVGTIISAAAPVFTRRNAEAASTASDQARVLQEQITELQAAVTANAGHIRELAEQLQTTVGALEQAASIAESRLRRALVLCVSAAVLSVVSLGLSLVAVFAR